MRSKRAQRDRPASPLLETAFVRPKRNEDIMKTKLSITRWYSDTRHDFVFVGDANRQTLMPDELVQGGETYRLAWEDTPDEIKEALRDLNWRLV